MRLALLLLVLTAASAWGQGFATLEGHGGPIHDVTVSRDGGYALTASFDNSVGWWNLKTGDVRWLDGHEAAVKSVVFTGPDSAASGGDDFSILLWDLTDGSVKHRLHGHNGQVSGLAASPDGAVLASASWDGTIGVWHALGNRFLKGHSGAVNAVAFSADGTQIFSASADGTIRVWDTQTGAQERILVRHGFGVTCLLIGPNDDWLVYGAVDGGTRVIDLQTGNLLADLTLDRRPVLDIAATPDFRQIAVGDGEGHIMVVNTADWDIVHDFRAALRGPIWALAYTADGQSVLAGGIDDTVHVWPIGAKSDGPILGTEQRDFLKAPESMSNGERQFQRKCSICHSLGHDGIRRAGPPLAGLFGRAAGAYPGYIYSDAVAKSGITWDAATIDALFDQGPALYIPGTKMPMQRITGAQDRRDLIDFLREHTKG